MFWEYIYIIRTVDNKKYRYESTQPVSKGLSLNAMYKEIVSNECIEVEGWEEENKVAINTNHIVSIEKWL